MGDAKSTRLDDAVVLGATYVLLLTITVLPYSSPSVVRGTCKKVLREDDD
jgi:hypothetical protein